MPCLYNLRLSLFASLPPTITLPLLIIPIMAPIYLPTNPSNLPLSDSVHGYHTSGAGQPNSTHVAGTMQPGIGIASKDPFSGFFKPFDPNPGHKRLLGTEPVVHPITKAQVIGSGTFAILGMVGMGGMIYNAKQNKTSSAASRSASCMNIAELSVAGRETAPTFDYSRLFCRERIWHCLVVATSPILFRPFEALYFESSCRSH